MIVWTVCLLLMFFGSALSDGGLLAPCNRADIECLSQSTTTFLERTHKGLPEYNFLPIDPISVPSGVVRFEEDLGFYYKYKNVVVTGLKHQTISDFKMDTDAKSVVLTTKADLTIVGDLTVEFTNVTKHISGSSTITGSVLGTATYNYELKNDSKGVLHFEVGPETITCRVVTTPEAQLNPEFAQALRQDEDFKKLPKEKFQELRSKAFCKVVSEAYKSVIHNIRAAAKVLPASAFFKDI